MANTNAENQRNSRRKKQESGAKRIWIPAQLIETVRALIKELEGYKG